MGSGHKQVTVTKLNSGVLNENHLPLFIQPPKYERDPQIKAKRLALRIHVAISSFDNSQSHISGLFLSFHRVLNDPVLPLNQLSCDDSYAERESNMRAGGRMASEKALASRNVLNVMRSLVARACIKRSKRAAVALHTLA